jgi:predicted transcriptional regulator
MAKMKAITTKLSAKQLRQLAKLMIKWDIDRSAVLRIAIARLVEEEANRNPVRSYLDK